MSNKRADSVQFFQLLCSETISFCQVKAINFVIKFKNFRPCLLGKRPPFPPPSYTFFRFSSKILTDGGTYSLSTILTGSLVLFISRFGTLTSICINKRLRRRRMRQSIRISRVHVYFSFSPFQSTSLRLSAIEGKILFSFL